MAFSSSRHRGRRPSPWRPAPPPSSGSRADDGRAPRRAGRYALLRVMIVVVAFPPGSRARPPGPDRQTSHAIRARPGEANARGTIDAAQGGGWHGRGRPRARGRSSPGCRRRARRPRPGPPRRRTAPARPPPHPRAAAARATPAPVVFVPGIMGSQLLRPGRHRGLAQPRQHARPPRPVACRGTLPFRAEPRRPAPRLPRRHRHRAAARVRLHRVRRRPRAARLGAASSPASATGAALRRLHLRLAARPRGERPRASRCGSRASRAAMGRPRRALPPRRPQHGRASWCATTCATAARSPPRRRP